MKVLQSVGKEQSNKVGSGVNYKGFQDALLKIIVKGKNVLNEMVERRRKRKLNKSLSLINGKS